MMKEKGEMQETMINLDKTRYMNLQANTENTGCGMDLILEIHDT